MWLMRQMGIRVNEREILLTIITTYWRRTDTIELGCLSVGGGGDWWMLNSTKGLSLEG